jgi:hypothetical protein
MNPSTIIPHFSILPDFCSTHIPTPQRLKCDEAKKVNSSQVPKCYSPNWIWSPPRSVSSIQTHEGSQQSDRIVGRKRFSSSQPSHSHCSFRNCLWLVWWKGGITMTKKRSTYPPTLGREVRKAGSWAPVPWLRSSQHKLFVTAVAARRFPFRCCRISSFGVNSRTGFDPYDLSSKNHFTPGYVALMHLIRQIDWDTR